MHRIRGGSFVGQLLCRMNGAAFDPSGATFPMVNPVPGLWPAHIKFWRECGYMQRTIQ